MPNFHIKWHFDHHALVATHILKV
ncbi:hypothetical protein VEx25_A0507, partial [Vibrio antiquarius]